MSSYELQHGDAMTLLAALGNASVQAIITDPPYEVGFASWDKSGVAHDPFFWAEALRVLTPGGYVLAFAGARTYHRLVAAIETAGFEVRDMIAWLYSNGKPAGYDISKEMPPALSPLWADWFHTLKPAVDPICVARKPFAGTLPANVQQWGTGALNVGGCRINGRRPSNVVLDDGAATALDAHAARPAKYFYSAKSSPHERQAGCEQIGGNTVGCVKPISLMRYLCRLVTPPGGTVLDPFLGSGSTGIAAILEGFRFLGFEQERRHLDIAQARMAYWTTAGHD